jgi:DNA-3-methyladenine glycosylase II
MSGMNIKVTAHTLPQALAELGDRDPDMAVARARAGEPPLRRRPAGFATLLRIIIAQQVSTASARAISSRLDKAARPLTPETFLALDDHALGAIGFSRQKVGYGRGLAIEVSEGRLALDQLARLDDEAAITELTAVKGIGRWTAEIYLMFALGRRDVWPAADLGLAQAAQHLKGMKERPDPKKMMELGEAWRPWRSVASLLLWHYLHEVPADSKGP